MPGKICALPVHNTRKVFHIFIVTFRRRCRPRFLFVLSCVNFRLSVYARVCVCDCVFGVYLAISVKKREQKL